MAGLRRLGIVVGTRCNFDCKHCLLDKETRNLSLSGKEKRMLAGVVREYAPPDLSFTGGETTLYIDDINEIAAAHPYPNKLNLGIVTNGGFASSVPAAKRVLASIGGLTQVQMSYDKFHAEFVPWSHIGTLYRACREMGVGFRVITTLQSPLDLGIVAEIGKEGDFKIGVQKVCGIGEAGKNRVEFRHFAFDRKVLRKFCPNRTQIAYQCGRGFSICCANLIFNGKDPGKWCLHKTPAAHMDSPFYKLMRSASFGRLVKDFGLDHGKLSPEHSSECALCEHIFRTAGVPKLWLRK